jgi:hypothetical protein
MRSGVLRGIGELVSKLVDHPRANIAVGLAGLAAAIATFGVGVKIASVLLVCLLVALLLITSYGFFIRARYGGAYEISSMTNELDIQSADGSTIAHRKELSVVFLHDETIAVWQGSYGAGNQFEDFECEPTSLRAVDEFVEAGRQHKLISLRHLYDRGDKLDMAFSRVLRNLQPPDRDSLVLDVPYVTKEFAVRIFFHGEQDVESVMLYQEYGRKTTRHDLSEFLSFDRARGSQVFKWTKKGPKPRERYRFEWQWQSSGVAEGGPTTHEVPLSQAPTVF